MVTGRDVRELLDERPDLEPVLEEVLAADEPFAFEDVEADSGTFGELVSTDLVTQADDGGYRLVDREAVRAGVAGDITTEDERRGSPLDTLGAGRSWPQLDRLSLGLLVAGLVLVVGLRLVSWPAVFRQGHVVLSSNDPYYYRYVVEQIASNPDVRPSQLGFGVGRGEPLFVVSLWLAAAALGGSTAAIADVMAWYPVGSALLTGLLLYGATRLLVDDRRVALAAVAMLAVLPGHAMRTSLGFADHHAFDYLWLGVTLLGVFLAARGRLNGTRNRLRIAAATVLVGLGITGQVLAWEAGPLLIIPVGGYVAFDGLRAMRRDESSLQTSGPVVAGTVVAAGLTWGAHEALNWHTTLVAVAPLLLAVGCLAVFGAAAVARQIDAPAAALAAAEAGGLIGGALLLQSARPALWNRLVTSVNTRLLRGGAIAETQGLFGQSLAWLLLFGFLLVLALPYLFLGVQWARTAARWLPAVVYGWYFLFLSMIQIRFVGQFALLVAMLAGLGFVHLAAWVDIIRAPSVLGGPTDPDITPPDRATLRNLALLFLLVTGLSLVQIPIKTNQLTISDAAFDSAMAMTDHSEAHDLSYPENYVFSQWGRNRMYNYFVNGQSQSYGYAQSNYEQFMTSTSPDRWYERLRGRGGYVVTTDLVVTNASALGTRLHSSYGSRNGSVPGLAHYRLIDVAGDGSHKSFSVVPGATVRGRAQPNSTVMIRTQVTVDDTSFTYTRQASTNADGVFAVRVPYPGTYTYQNEFVTVPEAAVTNGTTITGPQA